MVTLSIPNIQTKYPVLDNFKNGAMRNSDVIAYLTINVAPFALVEYTNGPFALMEYTNGDRGNRLENTVIEIATLVVYINKYPQFLLFQHT